MAARLAARRAGVSSELHASGLTIPLARQAWPKSIVRTIRGENPHSRGDLLIDGRQRIGEFVRPGSRMKKPPEHISARAGPAPRFSFEPFPKSHDILTLGIAGPSS
jgi:hypothetical protein